MLLSLFHHRASSPKAGRFRFNIRTPTSKRQLFLRKMGSLQSEHKQITFEGASDIG
jgi:hypothetical protein